jgi:ribosomal protein S18 acetylase RimI-like enzyme
VATVRRATLADADAIGRVHVRAWQAAYQDVLSAEALEALDPDQRAQMWRARLRSPIPGQERLVAVDAGAVVGFALVGTADDGRAAEVGQLYSINLTPEAWGRGTGEALLRRAEEELAARGHRSAFLWVAEGNTRARRFYERLGWVPTGQRRTAATLGVELPEVEYARPLTEGP